jgi:hypothetical protein
MDRISTCILAAVFVLLAAPARGNDGGWLEWLYHMDTKFWGAGTEIHLLCLDRSNEPMRCEEWFHLPRVFTREPTAPVEFGQIQHEFDLRLAVYSNYGRRFADDTDDRSVYAAKAMFVYNYHPDSHITVGLGAGVMPFFGDGFRRFARPIITPLSVVYAPFTSGSNPKKAFFIRGEASYIADGLNGTDFGNRTTAYSTDSIWNAAVAVGFDFRRRGLQ